jgi:hypothetical protein
VRRRSPRRPVQPLAVVLEDVQRVRGVVVLVPRVEHDRFLGIQCDVRPNEEQDTAVMMITKATTPPATSVSLCHSRDRRRLAIQPSPTGTMSKLT